MARFDEAVARLFNRVYVCKKCKSKKRIDIRKVIQKKALCKKCGSKYFRPIKKTR